VNARLAHGGAAVCGGRAARRIAAALAVTAVLAAPALAGWAAPGLATSHAPGAHAAPAQAASIGIDSINHSYARPGATMTVSGHFSNGSRALPQGLHVQLWSSASPFGARSQLQEFANGSFQADGYTQVATVALAAAVKPGRTVTWRASFKVNDVGMHPGGVAVYPLAAAAFDPAAAAQIAAERTFLPFWPGRAAAGQPVRIGWVWPLIDRPHRGICTAMTDNDLVANLASGRLAGLLSAGRAYAATAKLTWAVDPALLDDAGTMTGSYQVLDGSGCSQLRSEPASSAARSWLAGLHAATQSEPVFATPYADPDVAALTHRGLDADLAASFRDGSAVAAKFLAQPDRTIAWPPDGIADANVVDNLLVQDGSIRGGSVHGGIQTLVLDSGMMPPGNPTLYYTPDAVAQVHTGIGVTVRVLLADHALTAMLGTGSATSASPADGTVATSQRFLAETAMIAAEAPGYGRSVVVAPPRRWDPGATLAAQLLSDTVSAPWLRPARLDSLQPARRPPGVPAADRALLPPNVTGTQLSPQYLRGVRALGNDKRLLESFISHPGPAYRLAIARLESSAWRGSGQARGSQLLGQAGDYVGSQERMVSIIRSSEVTLGGSRGTIPVSIDNRLRATVQLRLEVIVPATRAMPASARLSVGTAPQQLITIGPHLKQTVRLQVHAPSAGVTEIQLRLLTPQGVPIPGSDAKLKVRATAFGTLALVIVAVALGVLVITFVARVLRRGLREGRAGNVVPEDNGTDDDGSAEAPDELADARGRAQPDARQ
jgi:Family of unknown function (DUF6049)